MTSEVMSNLLQGKFDDLKSRFEGWKDAIYEIESIESLVSIEIEDAEEEGFQQGQDEPTDPEDYPDDYYESMDEHRDVIDFLRSIAPKLDELLLVNDPALNDDRRYWEIMRKKFD